MKKHTLLTITFATVVTTAAVATAMPSMAGKAAAPAASAAQGTEPLSGKVLQTMNSGGYSYVFLEKKDGKKVWVAVGETPIKVGDKIAFKPGMEMANFQSKSLKRTFDSIIFSDGVASTTAAASGTAAKAADSKQAASPGSKGAATAKEKISVPKATGANAYTVEGIFGNSAKLDKKQVVVKGKVVKVSSGIMGKNWIHIQDGTGSQAKANHNLVCTSDETANIGDVITVTGTLAKDKDFGAGYKYNAIVENAKFKK
ncbi:DNA-binding protein [Pelotalea chapellei]|uniref:DNA-binding protein n=1 Tax=Pelotalea chapellei TaxID=44671 RepID=A0ABS5U697_9BACT|nr:DNA-binding protein [Pelotalea chapellei]MBT1071197.1 DNA-binding protein [Pelotalea chapellei]